MKDLCEEPEAATPLDCDGLEGLKFRHVTTRSELNELEQANIESGLVWLTRRRKTDILSEEFIRELHRRLLGEVWKWAGEFRRTGKNIGVDPVQVGIELHKLLGYARYWAEHKTYAPLEAGARFHHRLVQIHCFANGNGRHARIAADIYLHEYFGRPPIDWAAGHDLIKSDERRDAYIAALRAADREDYGPLLKFVGAI